MTREDLMTWVQSVARSLGYVIVMKRSKTRFGYVSKVVLMYTGMSIPLHSIDIFWRKLDFVTSMPAENKNVDSEMFEKSSPHQSGSSKFSFFFLN